MWSICGLTGTCRLSLHRPMFLLRSRWGTRRSNFKAVLWKGALRPDPVHKLRLHRKYCNPIRMKRKFNSKYIQFFYKDASSWENLKAQIMLFHCRHLSKEIKFFYFLGAVCGVLLWGSMVKCCLALPLPTIQASSITGRVWSLLAGIFHFCVIVCFMGTCMDKNGKEAREILFCSPIYTQQQLNEVSSSSKFSRVYSDYSGSQLQNMKSTSSPW